METSDSNAWVFDSLVGFLHGPVWNVPLQTFIEEKSLPFEPTDNGEVLNRPEYKQIHDEYKNLVDVMLGSFMDDIGITADQFEAACRMSARDLAGLPAHFHRRLFEQIWAANDYDIFVKMMTHKNVELQLQALELIERRFGMLPSIFSTTGEELDTSRSDETEDWPDSDDVMTELKKLSLEDGNDESTADIVPPEEVAAEKQNLLSKLQSFDKVEEEKAAAKKQLSFEIPPKKLIAFEEKPPPKRKISFEGEKSQKRESPTALEPPTPPPRKLEVSEEDVRARQEYLKQQRDKLLALKKQVRERRLGTVEAEDGTEGEGEAAAKPQRPRSARVAAAALAGAAPAPPPDAMQLRRALASKLKTEVVDTVL